MVVKDADGDYTGKSPYTYENITNNEFDLILDWSATYNFIKTSN